MSTVLTRVDNRLIHGQILESWVPYTEANCLIVINDDVSNNDLQKEIIKAFVPSHIEGLKNLIDQG
ncbi:PTS sugar transporter subunit IIB, partial [Thermodesulfobacteriota bacterium]